MQMSLFTQHTTRPAGRLVACRINWFIYITIKSVCVLMKVQSKTKINQYLPLFLRPSLDPDICQHETAVYVYLYLSRSSKCTRDLFTLFRFLLPSVNVYFLSYFVTILICKISLHYVLDERRKTIYEYNVAMRLFKYV